VPSVTGTSTQPRLPTTRPADQSQHGSNSDTGLPPRFSATDKGKRPAFSDLISETEEEEIPLDEFMEEATMTPPPPRPAQVIGLPRQIRGPQLTHLDARTSLLPFKTFSTWANRS
jgi:hypothetical protein